MISRDRGLSSHKPAWEPFLLEEAPDARFVFLFLCDLRRLVREERQLRQPLIALDLVRLERHRPFPFLAPHREQLLGRERNERDVCQEVEIVLASDGRVR